ncbi:hypothetical protein [Staphylococcus debuckii]|uniref:hypothetical protein n=1 Tax=Staphylococcus debuckii TaxID=2044912 RepID=UPI000F436F23|nr:hypothetical protein [Staphylococcus debuckii]AYU56187.1 hypothetical protein CNQ82_12400 [Staphylococcus debuckii]
MYEPEFHELEGKQMTLKQVGEAIEKISGYQLEQPTGQIKRIVAQKPNFESETDTFQATYKLNHLGDFVDVTFTAPKNDRDRLNDIQVTIQLITYITRSELPQA